LLDISHCQGEIEQTEPCPAATTAATTTASTATATTTASTAAITTAATTTAATTTTTTTPAPTTTQTDYFTITSSGPAATKYPGMMGEYYKTQWTQNNRPIYKKKADERYTVAHDQSCILSW